MLEAKRRYERASIAVMTLSGVALAAGALAIVFEFVSIIGVLYQDKDATVTGFASFPCILPIVASTMLLTLGAASFVAKSNTDTIRLQPIRIYGHTDRFQIHRQIAFIELILITMLIAASVIALMSMELSILAIMLLILDTGAFACAIYMLAISKSLLPKYPLQQPEQPQEISS